MDGTKPTIRSQLKEENERLAVLETKVELLSKDVTEIKGDVKAMAIALNELSGVVERRNVAQVQHEKDRADMGTWVRAMLPWFIALGSLSVAVLGLLYTVLNDKV